MFINNIKVLYPKLVAFQATRNKRKKENIKRKKKTVLHLKEHRVVVGNDKEDYKRFNSIQEYSWTKTIKK